MSKYVTHFSHHNSQHVLFISDEKDREIDEERNIIEKLTAEQKEWEKKIKEQHKNMGGVHMSSAHTAKTQKEIRTLENRLDKVSFS